MLFQDRMDAGRQLALSLEIYKQAEDTVVLGLARGGVVTAHAVARALHLPLNVMVVRKIGAPNNEELAIGAISDTGEAIFNEHLIDMLSVSSDYVKREIERQKKIAQERVALYRGNYPSFDLKDKIVIIVDDGIATGATIRVAIKAVKAQQPKNIVLAAPVSAPDTLKQLKGEVDQIVCLSTPAFFESVGSFYKAFDQTSDQEIMQILSVYSM